MYAVSACLVLVMIVMGVAMVNNFDRMKSVQTTLDSLTGETAGAGAAQTQETSGAVTAVTGEEQTGEEDTTTEDAAAEDAGSDTDAAGESSGQARESDVQESDAQGSDEAAGDAQETVGEPAEEASSENGSNGVYIVEKGDTLAIISRKMYGDISHVEAICKMNGITDGNLIYVGQKLLLP